MDPNIIVLITLLAMPNGGQSLNLRPFETIAACNEAAEIEAADPFVARVACSKLIDGNLTLSFKRPPVPGVKVRGKTAS